MALDWHNIPDTTGESQTGFGELDPNAKYNIEFFGVDRHRVFTSENSKLQNGAMVIFKGKTTNGNTGVGTYVDLMLFLDSEGASVASQQKTIRRLVEAIGENILTLPIDSDVKVLETLKTWVAGKTVSGSVIEGNPYNGKKQWKLDPWSIEKKAAFFSAPEVDTLVTPTAPAPVETTNYTSVAEYDF